MPAAALGVGSPAGQDFTLVNGLMRPHPFRVSPEYEQQSIYDAMTGQAAYQAIQDMRVRAGELTRGKNRSNAAGGRMGPRAVL